MPKHGQRIKAEKIDDQHYALVHPETGRRWVLEAPKGYKVTQDGYATLGENPEDPDNFYIDLDPDMLQATMENPPDEGTVDSYFLPAKDKH
jgi:hypothetical protein